jgi:adenylyl-sulfate reductase (glutathione)
MQRDGRDHQGRWWWEDAKAKECGLHSGNIKEDGSKTEQAEVTDLWTTGAVEVRSRVP